VVDAKQELLEQVVMVEAAMAQQPILQQMALPIQVAVEAVQVLLEAQVIMVQAVQVLLSSHTLAHKYL
jgi:hypothetical protein